MLRAERRTFCFSKQQHVEEIDFARVGENGALLWPGEPARQNGELKVVTKGSEYRAYDAEGRLVDAA